MTQAQHPAVGKIFLKASRKGHLREGDRIKLSAPKGLTTNIVFQSDEWLTVKPSTYGASKDMGILGVTDAEGDVWAPTLRRITNVMTAEEVAHPAVGNYFSKASSWALLDNVEAVTLKDREFDPQLDKPWVTEGKWYAVQPDGGDFYFVDDEGDENAGNRVRITGVRLKPSGSVESGEPEVHPAVGMSVRAASEAGLLRSGDVVTQQPIPSGSRLYPNDERFVVQPSDFALDAEEGLLGIKDTQEDVWAPSAVIIASVTPAPEPATAPSPSPETLGERQARWPRWLNDNEPDPAADWWAPMPYDQADAASVRAQWTEDLIADIIGDAVGMLAAEPTADNLHTLEVISAKAAEVNATIKQLEDLCDTALAEEAGK